MRRTHRSAAAPLLLVALAALFCTHVGAAIVPQTQELMEQAAASFSVPPPGWDTADACLWPGVTCSSGDVDEVTTISLPDAGIVGDLPREFFMLRKLEVLDLSGNAALSGTLPHELATVTTLTQLNLSNTNVTGTFPEEFDDYFRFDQLPGTYLSSGLDVSGTRMYGVVPQLFTQQVATVTLASAGDDTAFFCPLPACVVGADCGGVTDCVPLSHQGSPTADDVFQGGDAYAVSIQAAAMYDLLEAMDSAPADWVRGNDPCTWGGVSCSAAGHVERIEISGSFSAIAQLPSTLGALRTLQFVDLSSNNIAGTLPDVFGPMAHLQSVDLGNNELTGTLPVSLLEHHNVDTIRLNNNNFADVLYLRTFGRSLRVFDVSGNVLGGPLSNNMFTSYAVEKLEEFNVANNLFGSFLPTVFEQMTATLTLTGNYFLCPLPSCNGVDGECGGLTGDTCMQMDYLNGGTLTTITNLDMQRASDHVILVALREWWGVTLWVEGDDEDVCSWSSVVCDDARRVIELSLPSGGVNGELPFFLQFMSSLRKLDLSDNNLGGSIPAWSQMLELQELYLNGNALEGTLPSELDGCASLRVFHAHNNHLQGTIPEYTGWANLQELSLYDNNLYGRVPLAFGDNLNLNLTKTTGASGNRFFCPLPANCGANCGVLACQMLAFPATPDYNSAVIDDAIVMHDLRAGAWSVPPSWDTSANPCTWGGVFCANGLVDVMDMDSLKLGGTLPTSFKDLEAPGQLYLHDQALEGELPDFVATTLTAIYFDFNFLSGSMPTMYTQRAGLDTVSLTSNRLTGVIPSMTSSRTLFAVSNNWLTGELDGSIVSNTAQLFVANNLLRSRIPGELQSVSLSIASLHNTISGTDTDRNEFLCPVVTCVATGDCWGATTVACTPLSYVDGGLLPFSPADEAVYTDAVAMHTLNAVTLGWMSEVGWATGDPCGWTGVSCASGRVSGVSISAPAAATSLDSAEWSSLTSMASLIISDQQSLNEAMTCDLLAGLTFTSVQVVASSITDLNNCFTEFSAATVVLSELPVTSLANTNFDGISGLTSFTLSHTLADSDVQDVANQAASAGAQQITITDNPRMGGGLDDGLNSAALTDLDLSRNALTGTIPDSLFSASTLATVHLANNELSGAFPGDMGLAPSLTEINLSGNAGLYGYLPTSVPGSLSSAQFDTANVYCPTTWPTSCTTSPADALLSEVLSGNEGVLTDWTSPPTNLHASEWCSWSGIGCKGNAWHSLDLPDRSLAGNLPDVTQWEHFEQVDLGGNAFVGDLAHDWSAMSVLRVLRLENMNVTGTLPASLVALSSLNELRLDNNAMSGTLPSDWSAATSLTAVALANNGFEGELPETLTTLSSSPAVDLQNNKLYGEWPEVTLSAAFVNGNKLTCPVPDAWVLRGASSCVSRVTSTTAFAAPGDGVTLRPGESIALTMMYEQDVTIDVHECHIHNVEVDLEWNVDVLGYQAVYTMAEGEGGWDFGALSIDCSFTEHFPDDKTSERKLTLADFPSLSSLAGWADMPSATPDSTTSSGSGNAHAVRVGDSLSFIFSTAHSGYSIGSCAINGLSPDVAFGAGTLTLTYTVSEGDAPFSTTSLPFSCQVVYRPPFNGELQGNVVILDTLPEHDFFGPVSFSVVDIPFGNRFGFTASVFGTNFDMVPAGEVSYGRRESSPDNLFALSPISASEMQVSFGFGEGSADVEVALAGEEWIHTGNTVYQYGVDSVSPTSGREGQAITVTGSGFGALPSGSAARCVLGGSEQAALQFNDGDDFVVCEFIGSVSLGSQALEVRFQAPGGTLGAFTNDNVQYHLLPSYSLATVVPTTIPSGGGVSVVLQGGPFDTSVPVVATFDGIAVECTAQSSTAAECTPPSFEAGQVSATVEQLQGGSSNSVSIGVWDVDGVSPTSASMSSPSLTLVFVGSSLAVAPDAAIRCRMTQVGVQAETVVGGVANSASQITCSSMELDGFSSGTVDVAVSLNSGVSFSAPEPISLYAAPPAYALTPTQGPTSGGVVLTLTGSFVDTGDVRVRFESVASASSFVDVVPSSTQDGTIEVVSPPFTPGETLVRVGLNGESFFETPASNFVYYDVVSTTPEYVRVSTAPTSVRVVLRGSTTTSPTCRIDGSLETPGAVQADGATVVCLVSGAGRVQGEETSLEVRFVEGGLFVSAGTIIFYDEPVVTDFSQRVFTTNGGVTVTLTGSGFTNTEEDSMLVKLGDTLELEDVSVISDTQLELALPSSLSVVAGTYPFALAANGETFSIITDVYVYSTSSFTPLYVTDGTRAAVTVPGQSKAMLTSGAVAADTDVLCRVLAGGETSLVSGVWMSGDGEDGDAIECPLDLAFAAPLISGSSVVAVQVSLLGDVAEMFVSAGTATFTDLPVLSGSVVPSAADRAQVVSGTTQVRVAVSNVLDAIDSPSVLMRFTSLSRTETVSASIDSSNEEVFTTVPGTLTLNTYAVSVSFDGQTFATESVGAQPLPSFVVTSVDSSSETQAVTDVEPTSGVLEGGTVLTVSGFFPSTPDGRQQVRLVLSPGGTVVGPFECTINSASTSLECPLDEAAFSSASEGDRKRQTAGTYELQIRTTDGASFTSVLVDNAGVAVEMAPRPVVATVEPLAVTNHGGTEVTIVGTEFVPSETTRCAVWYEDEDTGLFLTRFYGASVEKDFDGQGNDRALCTFGALRTGGGAFFFFTNDASVNFELDERPTNFEVTSLPCGPGFEQPSFSSVCTPCPVGMANAESDGTCSQCPQDSYADTEGAVTCTPCDADTGSLQVPTGVLPGRNRTHCGCAPDFYRDDSSDPRPLLGEPCTPCPDGGECPGAWVDTTRPLEEQVRNLGDLAQPVPKEGFWSSADNPYVFLECFPSDACPGGKHETCADEYDGRQCGECRVEYYRLGETCEACPDGAWMRIVGFVVLFVVMLPALVLLARQSIPYFVALGIGWNYWQVLSLFASFEVEWPRNVQTTMEWYSITNFNIDLLATECSVTVDWSDKWLATLVLPIVVALVFAVVYGLALLREKGLNALLCRDAAAHKSPKVDKLRNTLTNGFLMLLFLAYVRLSETTLEIFDCTHQADDTWTLDAQPSFVCLEGDWLKLLPVAVLATGGYVVGIPLLFVRVLRRNRYHLDNEVVDERYGFLYNKYQGNLWYWEVVILLRKLVVILCQTFFTNHPLIAVVFALIAMFTCTTIQLRYFPFVHKRYNVLEFILLVSSSATLFSGLLFFADKMSDTGRNVVIGLIVFVITFSSIVVVSMVLAEIGFRYSQREALDSKLTRKYFLFKLIDVSFIPVVVQWYENCNEDTQETFRKFLAEVNAIRDEVLVRTRERGLGKEDKWERERLSTMFFKAGVNSMCGGIWKDTALPYLIQWLSDNRRDHPDAVDRVRLTFESMSLFIFENAYDHEGEGMALNADKARKVVLDFVKRSRKNSLATASFMYHRSRSGGHVGAAAAAATTVGSMDDLRLSDKGKKLKQKRKKKKKNRSTRNIADRQIESEQLQWFAHLFSSEDLPEDTVGIVKEIMNRVGDEPNTEAKRLMVDMLSSFVASKLRERTGGNLLSMLPSSDDEEDALLASHAASTKPLPRPRVASTTAPAQRRKTVAYGGGVGVGVGPGAGAGARADARAGAGADDAARRQTIAAGAVAPLQASGSSSGSSTAADMRAGAGASAGATDAARFYNSDEDDNAAPGAGGVSAIPPPKAAQSDDIADFYAD